MRCLGPVLALTALALPATAQFPHLSFGAVGGVPLTTGVYSGYSNESPFYTVGPTLELRFGRRFAAEVDGLYRRIGSSGVHNVGVSPLPPYGPEAVEVTRLRANSVEIPILGKYYFGQGDSHSRFFVATGYAFRRSYTRTTIGIVEEAPGVEVISISLGSGASPPTEVGAVFGAGWTRKWGAVTISPTLRYTRWGSRWDGTNSNQLEILLSLRLR